MCIAEIYDPPRINRRILRNAMKCLKCGEVIESKTRHDFVECSCGSIFVDGGHDYLRRGFAQGITPDDYEDLSEVEEVR